MKEIEMKSESERVKFVKSLILSAGNKLASVHFRKRSDGTKRRMSFRLHVRKPTYAKAPGSGKGKNVSKGNNQIVVFDTNKICYTPKGYMTRGAYRTIPLETVERVCVNGVIYRIKF